MHIQRHLLLGVFLLLSGCSGGGGGGTLGGIGNLPTDSPIPDASGTITDTILPDKPVTLSAGNVGVGSPLSSLTLVDFPSGTLSAPVAVKNI